MANASHNHLHSLTHVVLEGNIQYEVYVTYVDGKGKHVPLLEDRCSFAAKDQLQTYVKALIESHIKADSSLDLRSLQDLVITKEALHYNNKPADKRAHANLSLQTSVKSKLLEGCQDVQSVWDKTATLLLSQDYELHNGNQIEANVGDCPTETIPPVVSVTLEPTASSSASSSQGNSASSHVATSPIASNAAVNLDQNIKELKSKQKEIGRAHV